MKRIAWMCVLLALPQTAWAQADAVNDKLRDLLRQTTAQMRAAQDGAAAIQAQLDSMTKERDALKLQLDAAKAVPVPVANPKADMELKAAQEQVVSARAVAMAEHANTAKWQSAYQQAAGIARDKDAADRGHAASLKQSAAALGVCTAANGKLIDEAMEILHLYETPKFNMLLVTNHERLLGFKRVELENLVQDYEDRIAAQTYVPRSGP